MSILAWIVVGIIAGWLAEKIMGRDHSLLTNLIVGIIGAFVGGFLLSTLLGFRYTEGFNLASILVATLGAVVFLFLWGLISGRRHA
ncbi:MAG TPA: GlsB/YeaQ/YmgE family stress response membrane protein [Beijerinckiaceae bacterium]|nr:GlsB/YeaQ/YmgE family stress response membrane protein [Beijerinckiaceae bacterium]